VHDAARPGITPRHVETLINQVQNSGMNGGILALPLADTLKKETLHESLITTNLTVDRKGLWLAQTPQMFKINELVNSIEVSIHKNIEVTDEASAMENLGSSVLLVQGDYQNFKVTYPEDISYMERLLTTSPIRVGQGYDVHQLVVGRPLILGGIEIPSEKGLLGHSDADALLHAITDALLGAVALGDIGQHFPDTDPRFKGANSGFLLQKTYEKVLAEGYQLVNLDATIICQTPKLMQHMQKMTNNIAHLLQVSEKQINLKAKTNEGLGYLGESQAIETQAIVLITKSK
jgi:2-C-methyl-D-erythritol 2,4-cyclodiphosphate synthase